MTPASPYPGRGGGGTGCWHLCPVWGRRWPLPAVVLRAPGSPVDSSGVGRCRRPPRFPLSPSQPAPGVDLDPFGPGPPLMQPPAGRLYGCAGRCLFGDGGAPGGAHGLGWLTAGVRITRKRARPLGKPGGTAPRLFAALRWGGAVVALDRSPVGAGGPKNCAPQHPCAAPLARVGPIRSHPGAVRG